MKVADSLSETTKSKYEMAKSLYGNARSKISKKLKIKEDKRKIRKLVESKSFDMFIMSIIIANAIILGFMTSDIINLYFDKGLFLLDRLFMGIFIVEMALKIYALRANFFKSKWNLFDFTIVIVS